MNKDNNSISRPLRSSNSPSRGQSRLSQSFDPYHMNSNQTERLNEEESEAQRKEELQRSIYLREKELLFISNSKARLNERIEKQMNGKPPSQISLFPRSIAALADPKGGAAFGNANYFTTQGTTRIRPEEKDMKESKSGAYHSLAKGSQRGSLAALQKHSTDNGRYPEQATRLQPRCDSSNSPLRSKSPFQRHSPLRDETPTQSIPPRTEEYLQQIAADTSALQRRMGLVLAELDRVNSEKRTYQQKLKLAEDDIDFLHERIADVEHGEMIHACDRDVKDAHEDNKIIKSKLMELDRRRSEAINQLRLLQSERERNKYGVEEMRTDMTRKLAVSKELSIEKHYFQEQIQKITTEIEHLERNCLEENRHKHDVALLIERLVLERNDLNGKLEQLKFTFDNCVMEISREHAQMRSNNSHHTKLLVAKHLFTYLESMVAARKSAALGEFYSYCRFDQNCHSTLKTFVRVLDRLGKSQMQRALGIWMKKTFKPIEQIIQTVQLSDKFYEAKIRQRAWIKWRKLFTQKEELYSEKSKACSRIWDLKLKDCRFEKLRAFAIWRDTMMLYRFREKKVRTLIWTKSYKQQNHAFQVWNNHSRNLNFQVRMHLMAQEFTRDQLMQITFSQLKIRTSDRRRIRQHKLRLYFKGWKDSNKYRRYLMGSNVALQHFSRAIKTNLLKQCFDAIRQNKEVEKHVLMTTALEAECEPAIARLKMQHAQIIRAVDHSNKSRSLHAMKNNLLARVGSYFQHWKKRSFKVQVGTNKNLRDLVLRTYLSKIESAFATWKKGKGNREIVVQQGMVTELQSEHESISGKVMNLSKNIEKEAQRVDRSGKVCLTRAIEIMNRRALKRGLSKWKETVTIQTSREGGAGFVIKKMRNRLCRQAFDLYKLHVKQLKQYEKDLARLQCYKELTNARRLRTSFNAMCVYRNQFLKAKNYWTIVLTKIDLWMKRKMFIKWQTQGNDKMEQLRKAKQNQETEVLGGKQKMLKSEQSKRDEKDRINKDQMAKLRHMGERSLANCFARCFYVSETRGFEKWREWVRFEKHKEAIIKRTINHWKKHIFNFARAAMKNWVQQTKIHQTTMALEHTAMLAEEADTLNKFKANLHADKVKTLNDAKDQHAGTTEVYNQRLQRTIGSLIQQNDRNYFQSSLRYVFQQWAAFVARQKHFAVTIVKVMTKSMQQRGLQHITAFSKDKKLTRQQNSFLNKMRRRFWQHSCGAAFKKWRQNLYEITVETTIETVEHTEKLVEEHFKQVDKIKDKNCDRSEKIVLKARKNNVFRAWKNVTRWLKHRRTATHDHEENFGAYLVIRALKKWRARAKFTQLCRDKKQKMKAFKSLVYKRAVWGAWLKKYKRSKNLCLLLSNFAHKVDQKQLQSGFEMIQEFALQKMHVMDVKRKYASGDLFSVLHTLWHKRMQRYYSELRDRILSDKEKCAKVITLFGHFGDRTVMRSFFNRWHTQAKKAHTVQEVNEVGPVVEQVLDAQVDLHNLIEFMRKEGYTESQIKESLEAAKAKNKQLISRAVARLKHFTKEKDLYLKPKMFDRWRMLVKLRKLVKHWLHFIANRQKPVKADLAVAFSRWKYFFSEKSRFLSRMTKDQLVARCAQAADKALTLANYLNADNEVMGHLLIQRDELVANYGRSQRLALTLIKENMNHAKMKALSRWQDAAVAEKSQNAEDEIKHSLDLITKIKGTISGLENENNRLSEENDELRQFSMDGYQIAKNVTNLTTEREKLSVDLADKAQTIRRLLDENEKLLYGLRKATETREALARGMPYRR